MFGGGEEYFQDPPAIDGDTLRHFADFCARLRRVEKPGKKAIHEATLLARAVGDTLQSYELVIGALLRHIKTWTGNQQLACWYVLDKLCKEDRDKYGYVASKYILDIGRDYIPYEDPVLAPKYESLVEHWESVFSRHVVDTLWTAKKERLWAVSHPQEVLAQQSAEEAAWEAEEREMEDESGLNHFGQPCMDYLQGRCSWGENCRLLHPPGEEGSLPPECRMGDWKCGFCGAINRHFRRRCSNCVQEKKQYKRDRIASLEDRLLSSPDAAVGLALRQQFGYDPNLREEAIAHWKLRLGTCTHDEYMAERRAAYKTRILGQPATTPLEVRCQTQKHFGDAVVGAEAYVAIEGGEGAAKRARTEDSSLVPSGTPAPAAVAMLCQVVVERGIRDTRAPAIFSELTQWVRRIAGPNATPFNPSQSEVLVNAAKLAFTAWSASKESVPFVVSFFRALRGARLHTAGFSTLQEEQLNAMASDFL